MRTGRPKQPLTITEEERERLESLAHRARSQPLLARRAPDDPASYRFDIVLQGDNETVFFAV